MIKINTDKLIAAYEQDCKEIEATQEKANALKVALVPYVEAEIYSEYTADTIANKLVEDKQKQFDAKWATLTAFIENEQDKPAEPLYGASTALYGASDNLVTDADAESQDTVTATVDGAPADDGNI